MPRLDPAPGARQFAGDLQQAAEIAVRTVSEELAASGVNQVIFCCFDEPTAQIYEKILTEGN